MTEILVINGLKYELYTPKDEINDFHSMVKQQYKEIFGKNTLYFDIRKKLKSKSKIGSIPDAYILDFKLNKWYVVEEELSSHPVYEHIVSQLNRFLIGIKNIKSRSHLQEALYKEIDENENFRASIKKQTNSRDIHHTLTNLISKQPNIVVIIEEKTAEIEEAMECIYPQPLLIEFKTYTPSNTSEIRAHLFKPLNAKKLESKFEKEWQFFKLALEELQHKAPQIPKARIVSENNHPVLKIKIKTGLVAFYLFEENNFLTVDLYIFRGNKKDSQTVFDSLFKQKEEIEKSVGVPIIWERTKPSFSSASRILIRNTDYQKTMLWESKQAITWGVDNLIKLYQTLSPKLSKILN